MAGGYERNKQRAEALQLLGKDLARRSGRMCEICETAGVRLDPWEPPVAPGEPELDRTLFLCERCVAAADGADLGDAAQWRCLETTVWSDLTALQVTSIRLLRRLADRNVPWAGEALDNVYPSPETQAWLDE